jgi:hypothetical protein
VIRLFLYNKLEVLLISIPITILLFSGCCLLPNANWHKYIDGYKVAFTSGNGTEAIRFAKILRATDNGGLIKTPRSVKEAFANNAMLLGFAYELAGDYELAREQYRISSHYNSLGTPYEFAVGRTLYKQKFYHEAFVAYCNGIKKQLNYFSYWEDILCSSLSSPFNRCDTTQQKRLYPFANYSEFMAFIETEYQNLSEQEKEYYKESVEKFRQIKYSLNTEQLHKNFLEVGSASIIKNQ